MQNLGQVKKKIIERIRSEHNENPRLDAEMIISKVLKLNSVEQIIKDNAEVMDNDYLKIKELCQRRMMGEPMAYIVESKDFYNIELYVNKYVLIPRPETEVLVEKCLQKIQNYRTPLGLEFGIGSGCISISLLKNHLELKMQAVEISQEALNVAKKNISRYGLESRIELFCSDVSEFDSNQEYDFIISNPPYVKMNDPDLDLSVSKHEPGLALYASNKGLIYFDLWTKIATQFLKTKGWLFYEIGYNQAHEVVNFLSLNGFEQIEIIKDLAGHDRVVLGRKNG